MSVRLELGKLLSVIQGTFYSTVFLVSRCIYTNNNDNQ